MKVEKLEDLMLEAPHGDSSMRNTYTEKQRIHKMNIYFSHGKMGTPWSKKIKRLATVAKSKRHNVRSINYTGVLNPDLRVKRLKGILQKDDGEKILVGSSMGGYASLVASETIAVKGLFLLAPALYLGGYQIQKFAPKADHIEIVHGWSDATVPVEYSIKFAKTFNATLHILDSDHRLYNALKKVEGIFEQFLTQIL
ncbi:MAG: hypothetical protein B6I38_11520 [Anaerolineaceae bacterium 4572_5.1]|nr:MAG: hypothetical protein B6I38_11520 [Anaerolineaceae bacterium 4572_5.1]